MEVNTLPKTRKEAKKLNSKFFYTGQLCGNGHDSVKYTSSGCRECGREATKRRDKNARKAYLATRKQRDRDLKDIWISNNPEKYRKQQTDRYAKIKSDPMLRKFQVFTSIKSAAITNGIEFSLNFDEIVWPEICPVFKTTLVYLSDKRNDYSSASFDRINPKGGYTADNIQIISVKANTAKSNLSLTELKQIRDWMASPFQGEVTTFLTKEDIKRKQKSLHWNSKHRAGKKNLEHTIPQNEIPLPVKCPALGIDIDYFSAKTSPSSPTLDRFDSNKGYIKNNIYVISHRANTAKSNLTLEEFDMLIKFLDGKVD